MIKAKDRKRIIPGIFVKAYWTDVGVQTGLVVSGPDDIKVLCPGVKASVQSIEFEQIEEIGPGIIIPRF